jgi:hypothetical protein
MAQHDMNSTTKRAAMTLTNTKSALQPTCPFANYVCEKRPKPLFTAQFALSRDCGKKGKRYITLADRIPVGARYAAPVQTGRGAHPVSYTVGTGSFLGVKRLGRGVDHPPPLAPRLKKEYSYTSTPPLRLRGLYITQC